MEASPRLIEAKESLAFEILQCEQLGTVSPDFLENPIVNLFIRSKYNDTQNNSYHFQQSVETFGDDLFPCDNDLEDYTSYDMQEPINSLTESNTLSTTISRSNREQEIELLNPILSLNAMESNHKIDDLISNFKSVLSSRKPYAIKAMWDENPSLQAWYSGQPVNFGNNQSQQPRVITLDNLINSFKSALSGQTAYIIKAMWDGNSLLRAWYSGQPVNFGNNQSQQPDMRAISLDELINNFKSALSSHAAYIIKAMWDENPLLRAWYSGQQVDFGNHQLQQPDMRTISLDELINNFKSALSSQTPYISKAMWDGNVRLHNAIRELNLEQSMSLLTNVMASCKRVKSKFITDYVNWLDNARTIRAVLNKKQTSYRNKSPSLYKKDQIVLLQKRLDEMSDASQQSPSQQSPLDDLINNFKSALSNQKGYVIKTMWDENPLLREWYSGRPVNFGNNQSQQPDMRTISLDDLIRDFKFVLSSHAAYVIKAMWDENPLLRAWYSGQQVDFGNHQLQRPDMRTISLDELINHFKSVLSSRTAYVIKAMWDGSPLLQAWFSGQPVNFGNNQSQQPDMRTISPDNLISNFKSALSSHCKELIKAMWDGNDILHNAIRHLDLEQSNSLLITVMVSNTSNKNEFIIEYVNWLKNASTIRAVLKEIQTSCRNKKPSRYKARQIGILQNRLDEMPDASQQDSVTNPSDSLITTTNSNQLTVPTSTNRSKKRKALPEAKSSRRKKQRTEAIELELSNLVKKLPTQLSGQTHFYVEQAVGQALQKFPKPTKNELGIGSITKVRNKTQYKVEISDLSKYRDAYNKYTASQQIESNTSSTTISRSDTTAYISQTTSSPTLFGHQFNTQNTNTFVARHTNTSKEDVCALNPDDEDFENFFNL